MPKLTTLQLPMLLMVLLLLSETGCAVFTTDTWRNEYLSREQSATTAASTLITPSDLERSNGVFFGIAMSGGGSRAANFSAAVLLQLEDLGLLKYVTAISSVSGSSLTAAYYGLFRDKKEDHWNRERLREILVKNFEARWIGRWFLPQNILRYWTTNFSRSDIMEDVFDSNLFERRIFRDMPLNGPRVLINATSFTTGQRFVFSDETFRNLNSRLDTVPVSHAVMASGAFPLAFHDVTLKDYRVSQQQHYEHLFDGGPADNLGVTTLIEMVRRLYDGKDGWTPKGCLLLIVDAYTYQELPQRILEADTRKAWDFIFDTNVIEASDVLLATRRFDLLKNLGIKTQDKNLKPFQQEVLIFPERPNGEGPRCVVWELTFQRLLSSDLTDRGSLPRQVGLVVNAIPTRYQLTGVSPYNAETLQDYIYKATDILLREDSDPEDTDKRTYLERVCDWLAGKLSSEETSRDRQLTCRKVRKEP